MTALTQRQTTRVSRAARQLLVYGSLMGLWVGILGCGGDTTTAPPPLATRAFWALQLNQHAVNLALQAPYNTMQLTATPLTVAGTPLAGVGQATFQASDSTVTVDAQTGVITAHYVTAQTQVIATLQVQGVTLADTAYVQVTATPLTSLVATLSVQPVPGDSAKRSFDSRNFSWPATVTDAVHDTICSANVVCPLLIYYTTSDPYTLHPVSSQLSGIFTVNNVIGQTWLTATTWAYGVAKQDSVLFTVGYNIKYSIILTDKGVQFDNITMIPKKVVLGVGAVVNFWNKTGTKAGITFDDTTGLDTVTSFGPFFGDSVPPDGRGNIAAFGVDTLTTVQLTGQPCSFWILHFQTCSVSANNTRSRRFRTARDYKFVTTLFPVDTFELDIR